jgi:hypothetical protein
VGGEAGLSQSWNRYAYVRGNPVNANDPDGRCGGICISIAVVAFTAAMLAPEPANAPTSSSDPTYENSQGGAAMWGAMKGATTVALAIAILKASSDDHRSVDKKDTYLTKSSPASTTPSKRKRVNRLKAIEGAGPHTVFKADQSGKVTGYTEFDASGKPVKRFRGTGAKHGGMSSPLILEPKKSKGPGSPPKVPRKPRRDELPGGYVDEQ